MHDLRNDAFAVLFPAFSELSLDEDVLHYLDNGGVSLIFGESREEYLACAMSSRRRHREIAADFEAAAATAQKHAKHPLLIAADQELGGIQRLHDLVPPLPSFAEALVMSSAEISRSAYKTAARAKELGITMFLSPVVDVVSGINPWLDGRNLGCDGAQVSRIACAFIEGSQKGGLVATAKHFPGHPVIELDPSFQLATVGGNAVDMAANIDVFRNAVAQGVLAVMLGPALVPLFDASEPSSTSRSTVRLLREGLGFTGLIVSDDLGAEGIRRGREVKHVAVAALAAGVDLLLVSSDVGLDAIAGEIVAAVESGRLERSRLVEAASRVRQTACQIAVKTY